MSVPWQPLASVTVYEIIIVPAPVAVNKFMAPMVPGPSLTLNTPPAGDPTSVRVPPTQSAVLGLVMLGAGGVQTPGIVTAAGSEAGPKISLFVSQVQRVRILNAGPYVGMLEVQPPLFTEYST